MPRIEKLSPTQAAAMPLFREKYLRMGLSTEPADRAAAEEAIRDAYRAANMAPPATIIWLLSPAAGALAAAMIAVAKTAPQARDQVWTKVWAQVGAQVEAQVGDQVWAQVWAQVRAQVRAQVGAQVGDQIWDQVWDQVRDQVRAQVRDQVWDQVWAQVRAQVGAQVGAQVWAQVRAQVRDHVYHCGYGSHDAGWLAFYDFFAAECGIRDALRLAPLNRICAAAGWWWPFEGLCIATDRPEILSRDAGNRLHSEDGMALRYRDGWGIYVWHGYRIPATHEWIIADKSRLTPDAIEAEPNAELRRVMLEVFGFDRYCAQRGARVIDADEMHGQPRRLLEVTVRGEPIRVLDVTNGSLEPDGSRRRFHLGAMPGARTVYEAVAASYGINPAVYVEAVRT